jgi:arylsulfatase
MIKTYLPAGSICVLLGTGTFIAGCKQVPAYSDSSQKPNIIFILADDLGYGDLGAYGQKKIETPNIDRLAATGMLFTQHYSGSPVCAPSRCILLTGLHSGHAQVRGNDEWSDRGDVWNYRAMIADSTLEGQRPLRNGTVTIPMLLKKAGYVTGMSGKWGLGAPHTGSIPTKMGFDWFFGINCQRMAHTFYPNFLYENEHRFLLKNDTVAPGTRLPANTNLLDPAVYSPYNLTEYAPEVMFTKMSEFVLKSKDKPIFLYWASQIPHAALQAPQRWVDHYVKKFGDEKPYAGDKGYFPHRYPHAAYAAMVSYLDEQVGMLIKQLKELGIYENTLIIFTSDNGPTYNGGTDSPWFESAGPFRCGQGFGKGNVNEGGIRVPFIASWPAVIKPETVSDHVSAFWDILPTFCEIAGVATPDSTDGISLLPELSGKKQKEHEFLYWEFPESGGQIAVRMGNFKAMKKNLNKEDSPFQLYDIIKDPGELSDISAVNKPIIDKIEQIVIKEHTRSANDRWQIKFLDN